MAQQPKSLPNRRRIAGGALALACSLFLSGCAYVPGTASPYQQYRQRLSEQRAIERAAEAEAAEEPQSGATVAERLSEGDRARRSGDLPRAMLAYLQAYQLDPGDLRSSERIAYLHLAEDPRRAEILFVDLAESKPDAARLQLGIGLARLAQGRAEDARAPLERAVKLDPSSATTHYALSVLYEMQGHSDAAYAYASRARDLDPRDAGIIANLGVAQLTRGNAERAERTLRRAVLLDPRTPSHHNNLGLALGMLGRYDEALVEFRAGGSEQTAQNNLGYVHFLQGNHQQAVSHYERALLADGDEDAAILANLVRALDELEAEDGEARVEEPRAAADTFTEEAASN